MKLKDITEQNRVAWNAVTPFHQKVKRDEWDNNFKKSGYIIQEDPELSKLKETKIAGKKIIHLCCNNGRELLSLKNMGADYCLGVDICDAAIIEARERAAACNIDVDYLRSDVFDLGDEYNDCFDLVYMTIGGLVWLPEINNFFTIVNRLLKPGGQFFIYDSHPFTNILPWDGDENTILEIKEPYFHPEIWEWSDSMDYYGGAEYEAPLHYEFTYTLSEIIMALIENNLEIKFIGEYEKDISCGFEWLQQRNIKLPLSYILIGQKQKDIKDGDKTNKTGRSTDSKI